MARGVKKLLKGKHKATRPIEKDKWNSDDLAVAQFKQDNKLKLHTKGPHTGSNDSFA